MFLDTFLKVLETELTEESPRIQDLLPVNGMNVSIILVRMISLLYFSKSDEIGI